MLGGEKHHIPGLIVRSGGDSTTDEDDLGLHEHLLAGGEDGAVGDDEVLDDLWVGHDDEQLVAEPHGEHGAKLLGPLVQNDFGVVAQERERA